MPEKEKANASLKDPTVKIRLLVRKVGMIHYPHVLKNAQAKLTLMENLRTIALIISVI